MEKYKITKEQALAVKGIGILLMLTHHFFTFPQWYVVDYGFDFSLFREPTKICVAIFAFISGWSFCLKELDAKAVVKKSIKILTAYWFVYIPLLLLAILLGYKVSLVTVVLEAFGLEVPIMVFCWYIYFYIISIVLIWITKRLLNKGLLYASFIGVLVPMAVFFVLKKVFQGGFLEGVFYHLAQWYPCISMGYIANRYDLFYRIKTALVKIKANNVITYILGIIIAMICRYFFDKLDFIYGGMVVFSFGELLSNASKICTVTKKCLKKVGEVSMFMWFIHCAFLLILLVIDFNRLCIFVTIHY